MMCNYFLNKWFLSIYILKATERRLVSIATGHNKVLEKSVADIDSQSERSCERKNLAISGNRTVLFCKSPMFLEFHVFQSKNKTICVQRT